MSQSSNNDNSLEKRIVSAINNVGYQYQSCQGLILSEDDIKCLIYKNIYDLIGDHSVLTIDEEIKGSPLHAEIPFYDENGKLRLKPDITIIDPKAMSIKHGVSIRIKNNKLAYGRLPKKGFEFGGKAIIIEIKFCKSKKGIDKTFENKIREDISKVERLMNRNRRPDEDNNIYGIIAIFNKTNNGSNIIYNLMREYENSDNIKVIYHTGNVVF